MGRFPRTPGGCAHPLAPGRYSRAARSQSGGRVAALLRHVGAVAAVDGVAEQLPGCRAGAAVEPDLHAAGRGADAAPAAAARRSIAQPRTTTSPATVWPSLGSSTTTMTSSLSWSSGAAREAVGSAAAANASSSRARTPAKRRRRCAPRPWTDGATRAGGGAGRVGVGRVVCAHRLAASRVTVNRFRPEYASRLGHSQLSSATPRGEAPVPRGGPRLVCCQSPAATAVAESRGGLAVDRKEQP